MFRNIALLTHFLRPRFFILPWAKLIFLCSLACGINFSLFFSTAREAEKEKIYHCLHNYVSHCMSIVTRYCNFLGGGEGRWEFVKFGVPLHSTISNSSHPHSNCLPESKNQPLVIKIKLGNQLLCNYYAHVRKRHLGCILGTEMAWRYRRRHSFHSRFINRLIKCRTDKKF